MENPNPGSNPGEPPEPTHPTDSTNPIDPIYLPNPTPPEPKRFPWGWAAAGCGVIFVLVVIVGGVLAFKALPSIVNTVTSRLSSSSPLATPLPGARPAPTQESGAEPKAIPTQAPGGGRIIGDLPFKFNPVSDPTGMPAQSMMDQIVTTLNLNNDTDFMAPKSYKGSITLDPGTSFTLGNGWCAVDANTLQKNMANMQYQVSINGTAIDLSQYPTLTFNDNQGNACAVTGISITPSGSLGPSYHIVMVQKFLNSMDDGITSRPYPAGDVTFDLTVQFQATPGNGKSTFEGNLSDFRSF